MMALQYSHDLKRGTWLTAIILFALTYVSFSQTATGAQTPPPGYAEVGRRETERGTEITYVLIGEKLPQVDPRSFTSQSERMLISKQISELTLKKQQFQDQLARINSLRDQHTLYAKDLDQLTHELILDNSVHALNIIEAALKSLTSSGSISQHQLASLQSLITPAKASLQATAAATAEKNTSRRVEKAIDATFTLKNAVRVNNTHMTADQWNAFRSAIDTLPSLLRISQRMVDAKPDDSTVKLYLQNLDDALDAVGKFSYQVKGFRSAAHIFDGEIAMWKIRRDRGAIEEAFVQSSTAKRYYQNRLGEVEELLKFYTEQNRN